MFHYQKNFIYSKKQATSFHIGIAGKIFFPSGKSG